MKKQPDEGNLSLGTIQPVKRITDSFLGEDGVRYFRVVWKDTWEPELNLVSCQKMIEKFWESESQGLKNDEKVKGFRDKDNTDTPSQDIISKIKEISTCESINGKSVKKYRDECIQWNTSLKKNMPFTKTKGTNTCITKHEKAIQHVVQKEMKKPNDKSFVEYIDKWTQCTTPSKKKVPSTKNKGSNTCILKHDKSTQHDIQKAMKKLPSTKNKSTSTCISKNDKSNQLDIQKKINDKSMRRNKFTSAPKMQSRFSQTASKNTHSVGTYSHISDEDFNMDIAQDDSTKDCIKNKNNAFFNSNLHSQAQTFIPLSFDNDKEFCDRSTQNDVDNRSRSTQCTPQMEEVGVQIFQYLCSRGVQVNSRIDTMQDRNIRISKPNELNHQSVKDNDKFNKPFSVDNRNKFQSHEEENTKRLLYKSPCKGEEATKYNPIYFITSSSPPSKKQKKLFEEDQNDLEVPSTYQINTAEKLKQTCENNNDSNPTNILPTSPSSNVSDGMTVLVNQLTGDVTPIRTNDLWTQANLLVSNGITSQANFVTNINDDFIAKYWSPTSKN